MEGIGVIFSALEKLFETNNIAILILLMVSIFEGALIWYLLNNLLKIRGVLTKLAILINTLCERLNKHD